MIPGVFSHNIMFTKWKPSRARNHINFHKYLIVTIVLQRLFEYLGTFTALFDVCRLDPMFNASVAALANLGRGPRTESEQSLYNTIIQTFGTHYVTYVVVGVTARIYNLVGSQYFKSSSFEEMTSQVTKVSRFFFWSTYSTDYTHEIKTSVTESFKKNSEIFVEYQPPVSKIIGKTEWQ